MIEAKKKPSSESSTRLSRREGCCRRIYLKPSIVPQERVASPSGLADSRGKMMGWSIAQICASLIKATVDYQKKKEEGREGKERKTEIRKGRKVKMGQPYLHY